MASKQTHKKTTCTKIEADQRSLSTQLKDKDAEFHRDSRIVNRLVFGVQLALEEVERAEERVDNAQDHLEVIRRAESEVGKKAESGATALPEDEATCKLQEAQQEKMKRDDEWKKALRSNRSTTT